MRDRFASIGTAAALCALAVLVLGHAVLSFADSAASAAFFSRISFVLGRLDAPAWVQAVGSVVAIAAGGYAVRWQVRAGQKAEGERSRLDEVRVLQLLGNTNCNCIVALKIARRHWQDDGLFARTIAGFDSYAQLLQAVPLLQIPDVWVAVALARAMQERERLALRLKSLSDQKFHSAAREKAIDLSLQELLECERVIGIALAERGAKMPYSRIEIEIDTVIHEYPSRSTS